VRFDGRILWIFTNPRFDQDALLVFSQLIGLAEGPAENPEAYRPIMEALAPRFVGDPEYVK
jgi:hypothetical protein